LWARVRGITYMAYISGDIDRPTFIGVIRRSVIFGAIAGAIAVVAILAIAGFFVVMILFMFAILVKVKLMPAPLGTRGRVLGVILMRGILMMMG